jgi:hypothetical protein
VARYPLSKPAAPRISDPVQTEVTYFASETSEIRFEAALT